MDEVSPISVSADTQNARIAVINVIRIVKIRPIARASDDCGLIRQIIYKAHRPKRGDIAARVMANSARACPGFAPARAGGLAIVGLRHAVCRGVIAQRDSAAPIRPAGHDAAKDIAQTKPMEFRDGSRLRLK